MALNFNGKVGILAVKIVKVAFLVLSLNFNVKVGILAVKVVKVVFLAVKIVKVAFWQM